MLHPFKRAFSLAGLQLFHIECEIIDNISDTILKSTGKAKFKKDETFIFTKRYIFPLLFPMGSFVLKYYQTRIHRSGSCSVPLVI